MATQRARSQQSRPRLNERFYLDESGNSGDAALPGAAFDLGEQQIFALACVGCADAAGLGAELARVAALHRIKSTELKSTALTSKRGVAADIATFLETAQMNERQLSPLCPRKLPFRNVHQSRH